MRMPGAVESVPTHRADRHSGEGQADRRRSWWPLASLAAIAVLAAFLYIWALSRNGMANSYYAAAVRSATLSWKAFFFGSLDPGSFMTVDKPPFALWIMALSCRVFGFSSWSMLLPQAVAGVAAVLVLHRLVRRWKGEAAALLAALGLAVTPVAVLIFRYNNPDAILTLLLLLAAWAVWRAVEKGSTWLPTLAGVALGLAFLTKMLMAFMVLPAFVLVYLLCGRPSAGRRIVDLLIAAGAMLVSGGWWIAVVELWPDSARPHVGGTTGDSWIDLVLDRSAGILETAGQGANLSGDPGWLRLFNLQLGGQISWLLPLALIGLVTGLAITARAPRTDKRRAGYVLWGIWTLTMVAVFSGASGTLHSYYTVVLAPGIAALAGAAVVDLWGLCRRRPKLSWLLPAAVAGSAAWSAILLSRVSGYAPGLSTGILVGGLTGAAGLWLVMVLRARGRAWPALTYGLAAVLLVSLTAGPFAYSLSTIQRSITGSTAAAGPLVRGPNMSTSDASDLDVDEGLIDYLQHNRDGAEFLVAVQTTAESVPIILATGEPAVTIGGYKGRDPVPTVAELESMVAADRLKYVLLAGSSGTTGAGSSSGSSDHLASLEDWVIAHGTVVPPAAYGGGSDGTLYCFSAEDGA